MDTVFFGYVNQGFDYCMQLARILSFCLFVYALISNKLPRLLFVAVKEKRTRLHAVMYPLLHAAWFGIVGNIHYMPASLPLEYKLIYRVVIIGGHNR